MEFLLLLSMASCRDRWDSKEERRERSRRRKVHQSYSNYERPSIPAIRLSPRTIDYGERTFHHQTKATGIIMRSGRLVLISDTLREGRRDLDEKAGPIGRKFEDFVTRSGKAIGVVRGIGVSIFEDDQLTINQDGRDMMGFVMKDLAGRANFQYIRKGLDKYPVQVGDYLVLGTNDDIMEVGGLEHDRKSTKSTIARIISITQERGLESLLVLKVVKSKRAS